MLIFSSAYLSMFYILYLEINKVVYVKHGWDQFFYQGSGIKIWGKMGLRDQNNGKKIGINGSRIYHVTTLSSVPMLFARDAGHAGRKITLKFTYTAPFTAFVHIQLR